MFILICGRCGDLVRLRTNYWKRCECGAAGAAFDGEIVVYTGPPKTGVMIAGGLECAHKRDRWDRAKRAVCHETHPVLVNCVMWHSDLLKRVPSNRVFSLKENLEVAEAARRTGGSILTFYSDPERTEYTRPGDKELVFVVVEPEQ